jgi:hypothetical protein
MLRALFLILVFGNLVFFAWTQGYLGSNDAGREPQRLASQIAPGKLSVLTKDDVAAQPLCRLVTGLAPDDADGIKQAVTRSGATVDIKPMEDAARYWVHIPAQPNRAAADKKAVELKKLGVVDFTIESADGPKQHALTLGLFRTETAAKELLLGLTKRGVKSARIDVPQASAQSIQVTVRGTTTAVNKGLADALAKAPQAKVADCP